MKAIITCEFEEGETPATLAKQCRTGDPTCPMPIPGFVCPVRTCGSCENVKASDWKRFMKNGATYKEG